MKALSYYLVLNPLLAKTAIRKFDVLYYSYLYEQILWFPFTKP